MKFLSGLFFGKMLNKKRKKTGMNAADLFMALLWFFFWVWVTSVFLFPLQEVFYRVLYGGVPR